MRIRIEARGLVMTPALTAQVERLLAFHLSRFTADIVDVRVIVRAGPADAPGPSRRAVLHVDLGGYGTVTVEQTRRDAPAAVRQAARQAGRAIRRTLARARPMGVGAALWERRQRLR